ncbi:MAG TPA: hypothetical protein VFI30_04765 [Nocardioidaceae bacterium]|nr:hypothetical protein [Nocardioidaceae bacterium]
MVSVDVIDETFIVADPGLVRAALCDAERWQEWFPGLRLSAYHDRGLLGVRWVVSGALVGTAEVWLQEYGDGVVVHVYFRCAAGPAGLASGAGLGRRAAGGRLPKPGRRTGRALVTQRAVKARVTAVKDALEGDRGPAEARVSLADRWAGGRAGETRPAAFVAERAAGFETVAPRPPQPAATPAVEASRFTSAYPSPRPGSAASGSAQATTGPGPGQILAASGRRSGQGTAEAGSAPAWTGPWSAYGPEAGPLAPGGVVAVPDGREVVGEGLAATSAGRRSGADG